MNIWKLAHWLFLGRAIARGPAYFARYEVRHQARRAVYRATRAPRRRRAGR